MEVTGIEKSRVSFTFNSKEFCIVHSFEENNLLCTRMKSEY